MSGPLSGVRVVEIGSIGPGPFCAMLLADLGADVVRVDRAGGGGLGSGDWNPMNRGRQVITADLKSDDGRDLVLRLIDGADALVEGFRPGVMERLGLGPEVALERNGRIVYGRMTGYGQEGPMSSVAGHDINYVAMAGALSTFQRAGEKPVPPMNLVGDFGGGGMVLALGIVAALFEAKSSGQGQVVDAAMVEGVAVLTTLIHGLVQGGIWDDTKPGTNLLDTGAHFYETYETSDGKFMAVGAIEPQFYAELLRLLEIPAEEMPQLDKDRWPEFKARIAAVFKTKTRDDWAAIFEPAEACTTAIYGLTEAAQHPHNVARGSFVEVDGVLQPAPAPRFSRTPLELRDGTAALEAFGVEV
jgi:alpha-methylacyl-CoA racemase